MLFPSVQLVRRIEQAEAASLTTLVEVCGGEVQAVGGGAALYRGPGSPLNKVVGAGFGPLDAPALEALELSNEARAVPTQIELSTYADPAATSLLAARGYQLTGFENVLGCDLEARAARTSAHDLTVRPALESERDAWVDVLATGFCQLAGDEQAAAHDSFDRAALEAVFRDMAAHVTIERWVALREGVVVGGASMSVRDGITQLFGAATLPAHRRRGVQTALLEGRLTAGRARGSQLAVVTTQPGSKSHHNVQRAGFALLYARAVWLKLPAAV